MSTTTTISKRKIKNIVTKAIAGKLSIKAHVYPVKVEEIITSKNFIAICQRYATSFSNNCMLVDANAMNDLLPYLEIEINLKDDELEVYNYLLTEKGSYDYWIFRTE